MCSQRRNPSTKDVMVGNWEFDYRMNNDYQQGVTFGTALAGDIGDAVMCDRLQYPFFDLVPFQSGIPVSV